jgi:DNA-binding LacI/PurR family transcriptional regulator
VLAAAEALGYPGPDPSARSLRYGETRTLGVVLGEHLTYAFEDSQAVSFLAGISEVCADRGYGLNIVPTGAGDDDARRVMDAAVDAYVLWTTFYDDPVLDTVRSTGKPVVIHGGPAVEGLALISIDNREAARAVATEVFTNAKHPAVMSFPLDRRRMSFVTSGPDDHEIEYPVTRERIAGYRDAVRELGFDWSEVPVGVCRTNDLGEARSTMQDLLARDPSIDAIAAMSDPLALGARMESNDSLRLSGWDDSDISRQHGITSVAQSMREQGVACAVTALGGVASNYRDNWQLVRRASTQTTS